MVAWGKMKTTTDIKVPAELVKAIREGRKFIVAAHVQPDGDALGALLGLAHLLDRLGKSVVRAVVPDQVSAKYAFMPGADLFEQPHKFDFDTFIAVDVANADRLGDNKGALDSVKTTINIDHHPDNSAFAGHNWVDPAATSTSEMIFDLWGEFGLTPTPDAAVCIYVGMLTDTGNWQYANTTGRALRVAADLIDLGVTPNRVFRSIYERNSGGWLRLMGLGLTGSVIVPEHRFAYCVVTQSDLTVAGALSSEAENLVDWLRSLADVDVAVVIKETKSGEFKGSARSRGNIDVGLMARGFGGGGHRNAAGFKSEESPTLIVAKIQKWLTETGAHA